jgi:hypothetical protein
MRVGRSNTVPRFNLLLLLERRNRTKEALELAEETVRLEPNQPVHRGWRGILYRLEARDAGVRRGWGGVPALPRDPSPAGG